MNILVRRHPDHHSTDHWPLVASALASPHTGNQANRALSAEVRRLRTTPIVARRERQ